MILGEEKKPSLDELAHHGVKGMKWGVRRDAGHEGQNASTRKISRLDKKFEGKAKEGTLKNDLLTIKIHDKAADDYNKHALLTINNKPQYKNHDFLQPSPLRTKYYAEHQAAFAKALDNAAKSLGTNASGTKRYAVGTADDGSWSIHVVDVKHADDGKIIVHVTYDKLGHIVKVEPVDPAMAQAMTEEEFIAHFGVKGMKWGVRRSSSQPAGVSRFGGAKIQANNRAIKAREASRDKSILGRASSTYRNSQNKKIAKLQDSNKRITEGHKKIQDILNIHSNVGISDLLFTKTAKK